MLHREVILELGELARAMSASSAKDAVPGRRRVGDVRVVRAMLRARVAGRLVRNQLGRSLGDERRVACTRAGLAAPGAHRTRGQVLRSQPAD
jgi:hypothetical protein